MNRRFRWGVAVATLAIFAVLAIARLGHNSLWDDEALTALAAESVWATGDTGAVIGHNVVAYRSGALLNNLHDRSTPPLPAYLCAPFLGLFGDTPIAARLPFVLLGIGTVAVMLRWLWRSEGDAVAWVVLGVAIVSNVSLMLYSRTCRYYAPTVFFTVLIAYLYTHYSGRRRELVVLAAASIGLLATQYIAFAAVFAALGVDYLAWGRHRQRLTAKDWALLLAPVIVIGVIIVAIWNPLGLMLGKAMQSAPLSQKLALIWLNLRDLNAAEFAPLLLLAIAPAVYPLTRNPWLLRGPAALAVVVVVSSLLSPQIFDPGRPVLAHYADIRYILPALPLAIAIAALVLCQIRGRFRWLAIAAAVIVFGSNVAHRLPGLRFDRQEYSSITAYLGELKNPPPEPYAAAAAWINANVAEGQSVLALPDHTAYPLMFAAPKAVYAWQLEDTLQGVDPYKNLPPIHFAGHVPPDYLVVFGPVIREVMREFRFPPGVTYEQAAVLPVFWRDAYRPELFLRSFGTIPCDPKEGQGIYIFRKR